MFTASFILNYLINLAIYCIVTLIVFAISTSILVKNNDEHGVCAIMGAISWCISMILLICVENQVEQESLLTCAIIAAWSTNILIFMPAIPYMLKNIGKGIESKRENRRQKREIAKKVIKEVKQTIMDL